MEKECLIYYRGPRGKLLGEYCRRLEDLGFAFIEKMELGSLDYDIARFTYAGCRFASDAEKAMSLDSLLTVEESKEYRMS